MSLFEENIRYGGAAADVDGEDARRKIEERELKKAEVRKRLEEAGQKKQKKGFLTPERKKKLRKLLMIKAAEDLKRQQLLKEQERVKILNERTIALPNVDGIEDHGKLEKIYEELFSRLCTLEEEKYDINAVTTQMETTINSLNIEVNDLRGKYVKPSLKKVSKYDNKFKKLAEAKNSEEKRDLRNNLKVVKKESVITQIANAKKSDKPEWSKKKDEKKEEVHHEPEPVAEAPVEDAAEETEEEEEEEAEE